ncbi:hypothetical protein GQX74_004517 [Glossina fuscipes]|nr:hypothetical protein GQX74_004517 [Glossina fuscipes]
MGLRSWLKEKSTKELDQQHNVPTELEPQTPAPSYAAHFHEFLNNNFPSDFEHKLREVRPYIFTSFIMWPSYWLYRGLDWGYRRQYVHLPVYIHRTYLQAKIIQYGIISLGLLNANSRNRKPATETSQTTGPNLGDDLRQVVQSKDFENNVKATAPFLATGMLAWPLYWAYRGIGWHKYRNTEILPLYIKKTFYRAKAMELMILMTGIVYSLKSTLEPVALKRIQDLRYAQQK